MLPGLPWHCPEIDLLRSANWLAAALREAAFPTVEVWKGPGAPAVYAEWCAAAPGSRRIRWMNVASKQNISPALAGCPGGRVVQVQAFVADGARTTNTAPLLAWWSW